MNSLLILVPISLVLFGAAIWAFVWAVRRGQFDDLQTPAIDILAEEKPAKPGTDTRPATEATDATPRDAD